MIHSDNLDMSLSGLKTAVLYTVQKVVEINNHIKADIAASFQKAVTDVLIAKIKKTINQTNRSDVIIAGGVAANKYIRKEFKELENTINVRVYYPDLKYCGDNAAMIAFVGSMMTATKEKNIKSKVRARWPLNELKI
jgi:N6-L-threonylcarbamoyladenine synthase